MTPISNSPSLSTGDFFDIKNSSNSSLLNEFEPIHSSEEDESTLKATSLLEDSFEVLFDEEQNSLKSAPPLNDSFEALSDDEFTMIDRDKTKYRNSSLINITSPLRTIKEQLLGSLNSETIPENLPEENKKTVKKLIQHPGKQLNTQDMIIFLNHLKLKYDAIPWNYLREGMLNAHSITNRIPSELIDLYEDEIKELDFLFIPFVYESVNILQKLTRGRSSHIVLIAIDFKKNHIEYYDSLGNLPSEWNCYEGFNMDDDLEKIQMKCFKHKKSQIFINSIIQQKDAHNCGVFVSNYIVEKIKGRNMNEIISNSIHPQEYRKEMGYFLIDMNKNPI